MLLPGAVLPAGRDVLGDSVSDVLPDGRGRQFFLLEEDGSES